MGKLFEGRERIRSILCAALAVAVCAAVVPPAAAQALDRELVRKAPGVEDRLADQGAVVLEDYGRFLLVERQTVDTEAAPAHRGTLAPRVALPSVELNTRDGVAELVPETSRAPSYLPAPTLAPDEPGLHLIQFHGPTKPQWMETVRAEGIEVIAYVPEHAYLVRATPEQIRLLDSAPFPVGPAGRSPLHWSGDYRPEYKVTAELLAAPAGETEVVVRLADGPRAAAMIERLTAGGERQILDPVKVDRIWVVPVRLPAEELDDWAARPDIVDIGRWHTPELFGEVGALNVAGQRVDGTAVGYGDAGVDYMTWLENRGFDLSSAWSFAVNVVDTGLDKGLLSGPWHPDFMGPDGTGARMAYVKDWTTDKLTTDEGVDGNGHGTNCAGVVGGYNADAGTGTSTVSSTGYHFGTGVAPVVQIGGSKVFTFDGAWSLEGDYQGIEHYAYDNGARVSTNSWGSTASFTYDYSAYVYDSIVRDATPDSGSQPMVILFAAGNEGPGSGTVSSPGTAKNVITLGAAENWWPGYSACGWSTAMTDSPGDDIVYYSSRGPVSDGRIKPDLAAIANGWVTTRGQYAGTGCGAPYDTADGTLYRNFNGTSAATPAAAGAAALIYQHALNNWGGAPSPAMVKAALVATARDLAGGIDCDATNGTGPELQPIPNGSQGFGLVDTGRAFDGTPAVRVDQSVIFDSTGDSWMQVVTPADDAKQVKIALAWTDAPGSSSTRPWVNDLDLIVTHLTDTLHGNHLEGGVSVPGGSADGKNNLELAVLPASAGDAIEIEVLGANIAGNGLPNSGGFYDQDFALYVYNAEVCTQPGAPSNLSASFVGGAVDLSWSAPASGTISSYRIYRATSGSGPWSWIDTVSGSQTSYTDTGAPGGSTVYYMVRAVADCESRPSASASVTTPTQCPPTFGGVVSAAATANSSCGIVLEWDAATEGCPGSDIVYRVYRSTDAGFEPSSSNQIADGVRALGYVDPDAVTEIMPYTYIVRAVDQASGASEGNLQRATARPGYCTVSQTDPQTIPDEDPAGLTATAAASGVHSLSDVQLDVTITHPFMGDLSAVLTSPAGTTVQLIQADSGDSSSNLDTTFDAITAPDGPGTMNDFDGESGNGTWSLELVDHLYYYEGSLDAWTLKLTSACSDLSGSPGEVSPNLKLTAEAASGSAVLMRYIPAANATDTCVYHGRTTMAQQDPAWSSSTCGLGVTGSATFDPGAVAPRELLYFVAVGTDGVSYGSFGRNSSGAERPTTLTASSTTPLFERPRPAAAALRPHAAPPARSDRSYQMEPCP